MSGREEQANLGKVLSFLREWDRADQTARGRMLSTFIWENTGSSFHQLELEFAQVASLFLARITTWMRLTYKFTTFLDLQLKTIQIFLSASSQDQYLTEFLEDGGVPTLIDILNQSQTTGKDRVELLKVLLIVAKTGRKYKEFICESNGINALAQCLSTPYSEGIHEKACAVLDSLSRGNPKYLKHVYQEVIALLLNTSPKGQKMLLGTLRSLQIKMKTVSCSLVDPLLEMLKTLRLEVQEEAIHLILELKHFDVRPLLLNGLVSLLRQAKLDYNSQTTQRQFSEMTRKTGSLTEFVQQAAAAKVIRLLAEDSEEIRCDLISIGVVQHLLSAMGNTEHSDAQIQASLALEFFVRSSPVIQHPVKRIMGDTLFSAFLSNPETVCKTLSEAQAESLLFNNLNGELTNTPLPPMWRELNPLFSVIKPSLLLKQISEVVSVTSVRMTKNENSKRKRLKTTVKEESLCAASLYHSFPDAAEVVLLRSHLLNWYDKEQRELPWRTLANAEKDLNIRTYAVWVSEIMLQQTQVATVIEYYNKWIKRWPTVQDLAAATLEEVNQMWAGLGYYSRVKRLHEGAQKVVSELNGQMPRTVENLLKQLPGVGRYTAAAVGSIALGQVTGAVDGNVIRVLCRVRGIGADSASPAVTEALWNIVNMLVDPSRPGDFNQAMMELGARICTPKAPLCSQCPVQSHCRSRQKVNYTQEQNTKKLVGKTRKRSSVPDIEECVDSDACVLCPSEPWENELGVMNFPRKPAKKPPRVERTLTCLVVRRRGDGQDEYLLTQRPSKGLLAGLWQFPSVLEVENADFEQKRALLCSEICRILGTGFSENHIQFVGEVVHLFSHIHQTYVVYSACFNDQKCEDLSENAQWLSKSALLEAAVSTGVKKILKLYDSVHNDKPQTTNETKKKTPNLKNITKSKGNKECAAKSGSKQLSLTSFFKNTKEESC
ncbi:A/G-specific adenine DNA glycosylase [Eucyclogobius newberryi]|uniref:A/G-specific adenine DNA glycosylase n=1 Tax=Eucyclogobius newberryi TaxID=166745 RepID=UPI003B5CA71E